MSLAVLRCVAEDVHATVSFVFQQSLRATLWGKVQTSGNRAMESCSVVHSWSQMHGSLLTQHTPENRSGESASVKGVGPFAIGKETFSETRVSSECIQFSNFRFRCGEAQLKRPSLEKLTEHTNQLTRRVTNASKTWFHSLAESNMLT